MSQIKPGALCRIVCTCKAEHRDRIVTATRFLGYVADWPTWRVEAGWLGVDQMPAACLRPITDTDIDTADQVDCMDMNLLTVLPMTRVAA